MIIKIIN